MNGNTRFDMLCKALELKDAKKAVADVERALATGKDLNGGAVSEADRKWLGRYLKGQQERLGRAKDQVRSWV